MRLPVSRIRVFAALGLSAWLGACAAPAREVSSPDGAGPGRTADALLPSGDGLRVLRFGGAGVAEHAAWPAPDEDPRWLALAAPAGPFRPVQAVSAQRGYFLVVDAASSRLCLYDAEAALLSTFPLPESFTPFSPGRAAVFRGADGAFTFLDYTTGEAWQFADRLTGEGNARWIPRGRTRLPAGLRGCDQLPGSSALLCRIGRDTPAQFDGALNRVPARGATADGLRAAWDADAGEWVFTHEPSGARFLPAQRRMENPTGP